MGVNEIKKGSSSTIVFSTFGECGFIHDQHHRWIATFITYKKKESHLEAKLWFSLLNIRRVRERERMLEPVNTVEFILVPQGGEVEWLRHDVKYFDL